MRKVFICLACAAHYMPPASMRYQAAGTDASPVHCATPACQTALTEGSLAVPVPLELLERWALRAAERQARPRTPRFGRLRGRRPAAAPGGARSKLR